MPLLIQAKTISGTLIENATWKIVGSHSIREGQSIYLELETKDIKIVNWVAKLKSVDCNVERDEENKEKFYIIASYSILEIKHMLSDKKLETMVHIVPMNRTIESVTLYILDRGKCNPRFIKSLNS